MNKKVTILSKQLETNYETRESTAVYVDGKLIGTGSYGGEPEDNSRCRHYDWVESLLAKLAKELGADVDEQAPSYTLEQEDQYFDDKDQL